MFKILSKFLRNSQSIYSKINAIDSNIFVNVEIFRNTGIYINVNQKNIETYIIEITRLIEVLNSNILINTIYGMFTNGYVIHISDFFIDDDGYYINNRYEKVEAFKDKLTMIYMKYEELTLNETRGIRGKNALLLNKKIKEYNELINVMTNMR